MLDCSIRMVLCCSALTISDCEAAQRWGCYAPSAGRTSGSSSALCHGCNRDFPSDQCARSAETRFTVTSVIRPQEWIAQSLQDRGEDVEGPELSGAVPLTPPFRL